MLIPRFYPIVDHDLARAHGWTVAALARACLDGGARLLQLRLKGVGAGELLRVCEEVANDAAACTAIVVVNDRADVARLVSNAGVHVGQDVLPPALARRIVGPDVIVGFSTHTTSQVDAASDQPISYLAVGPVFGTQTKETGYAEVGLDLVRYAFTRASRAAGTTQVRIPIVAIGGITLERARSVVAAGASSVAVISDLLTTGDPVARVAEFVRALG